MFCQVGGVRADVGADVGGPGGGGRRGLVGLRAAAALAWIDGPELAGALDSGVLPVSLC